MSEEPLPSEGLECQTVTSRIDVQLIILEEGPPSTEDEMTELKDLLRTTDAELRRQAAEIAYLSRIVVEQRTTTPGNTKAELSALRTYAESLEFAYFSLLQSRFWKLTKPLRWGVRKLRGQPRPRPFQPHYLDVTFQKKDEA